MPGLAVWGSQLRGFGKTPFLLSSFLIYELETTDNTYFVQLNEDLIWWWADSQVHGEDLINQSCCYCCFSSRLCERFKPELALSHTESLQRKPLTGGHLRGWRDLHTAWGPLIPAPLTAFPSLIDSLARNPKRIPSSSSDETSKPATYRTDSKSSKS